MAIDTEARLLKIVLLGNSNVGKTTLAHHYYGQPSNSDLYKTIELDIYIKNVDKMASEKLMIQVWDTAGDDNLRGINSMHSFLLFSDVVILVFDLTDKSSFDHLVFHLEAIRTHAPHGVPVILVGNKSDAKNRVVESATAEKYAKDVMRCPYVEVSIKNPQSIDKLFEKAIFDATENINKPFKVNDKSNRERTGSTPLRKNSVGFNENVTTPTINVEEVRRKVSDVQATVSGWFGRLQEVLFE